MIDWYRKVDWLIDEILLNYVIIIFLIFFNIKKGYAVNLKGINYNNDFNV